jgi:hypothetical protein
MDLPAHIRRLFLMRDPRRELPPAELDQFSAHSGIDTNKKGETS